VARQDLLAENEDLVEVRQLSSYNCTAKLPAIHQLGSEREGRGGGRRWRAGGEEGKLRREQADTL